ncbi:MAG: ATPase, T2SS/T4P/T4SS family [Halobacteriota archaeon]|nr:ATPase, T2SS/T4P/T4SS family [Halobacteriota archaeon]
MVDEGDLLEILEEDADLDALRKKLGEEESQLIPKTYELKKIQKRRSDLIEERQELLKNMRVLIESGRPEEASVLTEKASRITEEIEMLDDIQTRKEEEISPKKDADEKLRARRSQLEEERSELLKKVRILVGAGKSEEANILTEKASKISEELNMLSELKALEEIELPGIGDKEEPLFWKRLPFRSSGSKVKVEDYDYDRYGPIAVFRGTEGYRELERYWADEPFSFISILYNDDDNDYLYHVVEPELTPFEKALLERTYEDLRDIIIMEDISTDSVKRLVLREKVAELIKSYRIPLDPASFHKILYYTERNYIGYGQINAIMGDSQIEDISCDGVGVPVFIYHRKYQSVKSNISYNEEDLNNFVTTLAQRSGKHISAGTPMVHATLPEGSRLQATLGREITTRGSSYSIRKFKEEPFTPVDLIKFRTFSVEELAFIWLCIENNRSMLFCGGTAAGKTSALNAVSLFIPPTSKIVTIEDTRELTLYHENWIASVTREPLMAGGAEGSIDMYELLRQALRQRPECMIVGEVRGPEALTLFQAMSTGHTTYSTMHAGSIQEAVSRLENEPINVPNMMLQALDLVSLQILTYHGGERVRRNLALVEITGIDPRTENIRINEVYKWNPVSDNFERVGESQILREIMSNRGWNTIQLNNELKNREKVLQYMIKKDLRDYRKIAPIIKRYFMNPEKVLEEIEYEEKLEEGQ